MEFGNLGSAVFEWVEDICRNYVLFSFFVSVYSFLSRCRYG